MLRVSSRGSREQCDVNCLHSLVSWYEEHRLTCPHEPQLRSLEPGLGFSTSALWQCQGGHDFHQHLSSPDREASDSENESHTDPEETTKDEIEKEETDESLGLLETPENTSEEREMQTGSRRSKRSRRGPVIEADGMLKMFHCPYEGCRQVYVAMSSFQNHVNLVHRKGRTKVCPHPGCGKKFYLSNHLHRHMIIHSEIRFSHAAFDSVNKTERQNRCKINMTEEFQLNALIAGGVLFGLGLWIKYGAGSFIQVIGPFSTQFINIGYICIGVGSVLVVIGLIGCCGAWKENRCLLLLFFCIVSIIYIAEVVGAVLIFIYKDIFFCIVSIIYITEVVGAVLIFIYKDIVESVVRNTSQDSLMNAYAGPVATDTISQSWNLIMLKKQIAML
ncbi:UNVERIFIED_CONTAM: hypothetical protein FKN15_050157 [Acipenser sinensis]